MEQTSHLNFKNEAQNYHDVDLEALKKFLYDRQFLIYTEISSDERRVPECLEESNPISNFHYYANSEPNFELPLDLISPITDDEEPIEARDISEEKSISFDRFLPPFEKDSTVNKITFHSLNKSDEDALPVFNESDPTQYAGHNHEDNVPSISESKITPLTLKKNIITRKHVEPHTKIHSNNKRIFEKPNPSLIQGSLNNKLKDYQSKASLMRQDFRHLKIWYDNYRDMLSKHDYTKSKLPERCVQAFMKLQKISREQAMAQISEYLSIRAQHLQPKTQKNDSKNSGPLSYTSNQPLLNNRSSNKDKSDPSKIILRLQKLTHGGLIQNKVYIHNLIHEMTSCTCQKTREECLDIILRSRNKVDCMEEFVKFGGVNIISSWLEEIASKSGINFQRNIVKKILDILESIEISNNSIRRSSIGKHVNLIVRSQLEQKYPYYCQDLNIVSQAQNLVSKWKHQFYGRTNQESKFQSPNISGLEKKGSNSDFPVNSYPQKTPNPLLTGILNSVKNDHDVQKKGSLEHQIALLEGEKKCIAKHK